MSSFKIRPRFKQLIAGNKGDLEKKLMESIEHKKDTFICNHLPGHLYIKIHPDKQHFWSPQLHLSFEQDEGKVIVRGLYGPNPIVLGHFLLWLCCTRHSFFVFRHVGAYQMEFRA